MKCHESSYYHHIHQWTSSESVFLACTEEAEGKSCERACFSLASDSAWKTKETLHLMPPELFNPHSRFVQIQSGYNWFIYFWKSLRSFKSFGKFCAGGGPSPSPTLRAQPHTCPQQCDPGCKQEKFYEFQMAKQARGSKPAPNITHIQIHPTTWSLRELLENSPVTRRLWDLGTLEISGSKNGDITMVIHGLMRSKSPSLKAVPVVLTDVLLQLAGARRLHPKSLISILAGSGRDIISKYIK